jgi:KRAB domain-containing zinc finger protein
MHEELFSFPEVRAFPIKNEREFCEEEEMLEEIDQSDDFYPEENLQEPTPPPKQKQKIIQYKYCDLCDQNIKANCYYSHFKRHHCEAMFVCDLDNKRFKLKNDLRDHMRAHILKDQRKKFFCSTCNSSFFSNSALRNHFNYFHSGYIEEHPCNCGKIFGSRMKLKQHQINVHSGRKFTCEHCGKTYDSSRTLRKHLENHTIGKIQCPVCGKEYYRASMNDHLKIHNDPYFECEYESCFKKFYSQHKLNNHMKSHAVNNSFLCIDCNSSYVSQVSYERHRARQHGVKTYCSVPGCEKLFSRKENAIKHYKSTVHKDLDAATRRVLIDEVKANKNISW